MRPFVFVVVFVGGLNTVFGQISDIGQKFDLPNSLTESSGAIFFNNKLITLTDSGGENKLYELDTISGSITRTVTITNATNTDWEDIAHDDTSIYIGDIGNNSGDRNNLKIFKINKTDYLNSTSVSAETIAFDYADQTDFTPRLNTTEWDAEALVSFNDSHLILFTKNWDDNTTKGYLIPKASGTHSVNPLPTSLDIGGLITAGTFNETTGKLYLVGYSELLSPFVSVSEDFSGSDVFSGTNTKIPLSGLGQEQVEAITPVKQTRYLMTSESFSVTRLGITFSDDAKLMGFCTDDVVLFNTNFESVNTITLYPSPVLDVLNVKAENMSSVEIFDTKSVLLYSGMDKQIDVAKFSSGVYLVKVNFRNGISVMKRIVKR